MSTKGKKSTRVGASLEINVLGTSAILNICEQSEALCILGHNHPSETQVSVLKHAVSVNVTGKQNSSEDKLQSIGHFALHLFKKGG